MVEFQSGVVSVDNKFARFGSKSFAVNKITSVDVRSEVTPADTKWKGLAALAALLVIVAVTNLQIAPLCVLIALVLAYFAWVGFKKSKIKTVHRLFVVTSGSEVQAYETSDGNEIGDLREAIENAMIASS
ncbi:hypothetical protein IFT54_05570 [Sphingomonas sp. CFBP 13714]|uniref:DUF6232 family protein n=1 Tax=Sphingomonas sp. CFBP 13714 TaxID=2775308 RepID=UPI00177F92C4|nr:DUF6232 family protein [Sphingomonas sp. CFBP 13714]MBD8699284.1 hypothetical protein [Sphingomonas sp. CFBP 13714]